MGIAVMDSPDAFRWVKGKELSMTSGYALSKEPHCLDDGFKNGIMQRTAGLMIKRARYMDEIPEHVIELFEKHDVPLISMPFEIAFMEVINQINVTVMNQAFRRFRIQNDSVFQMSNLDFKERKIKKILQAVEAEMSFPAFLYDINEDTAYYSSANFRRISDTFQLKDEDYWKPSMEYTRHTLCEHMHMYRYRLIDPKNLDGPRISWILIPIIMNDVVQAYFVVMESKEFIDYCDEYSIRIAFLELQSVYEQIMVAQTKDASLSARDERKNFVRAFHDSGIAKFGKMAFLDENSGIILWDTQEKRLCTLDKLTQILDEFRVKVKEKCSDMELEFAIYREPADLLKLKNSVQKCQKVMNMGKKLFAEKKIWDYEMLGPYAWIDIDEEELESMLNQYRVLMEDEKNRELLKTLKIYLENNMNYSITAEKMYVHINTIRKRISKVREILDVSLEDRISRLKIEMLLQFLTL